MTVVNRVSAVHRKRVHDGTRPAIREEAKSQKRIDAQQSAGLAGRRTAPTIGILILALIAATYTSYVGKEVALPLATALHIEAAVFSESCTSSPIVFGFHR